jgi:hypothetical protein
VQGPEFDSAVVARLLGREAADVEERLDALERVHALVRLVREQTFPDGTLTLRYGFVHVLYQNALYASLQPTRKAAWSAAAAQALLGYYGARDAAVAGELELLFEAARDCARAGDYFLRAAENAVRVCAHREAIGLARRGLELLQSLSPTPGRADARRQDARSLELRAVTSLSRLYRQQGRQAEAHPLLAETYGWFTEGFDTPDLQEARALLEQLS